jgi:undecaprenyl-diphosphatase
MSALQQLNYMLFQEMNAPAGRHPLLDALMIFCANLLVFCWPLLLLMVWGIPLRWRRRGVQPGETEMLAERRSVVLWVVIACLFAYTLNLLLEQFVFEPRPFVSHKVHLLIAHAADASFPSDHTAWSFAVVGMLLFGFLPLLFAVRQKPKQGGLDTRLTLLLLVVALVIACCIGIARVYVGVHYPGDVLGGAIDGLLAASVVNVVRQWLRRPTYAVLRFAHTLRLA